MTDTASDGGRRDVLELGQYYTDKFFHIGRYELTPVASMPAFFTVVVMNASLNAVGKRLLTLIG